MEHQAIEIYEEMSIPLASFERGNATSDLKAMVRIAWSPSEGIYAEPITYTLPGQSPKHINSMSDDPVAGLVSICCRENYDEGCLNTILHDDPAFRGAWLYVQTEIAADRAWTNSRTL